jgi:hypothetical protein
MKITVERTAKEVLRARKIINKMVGDFQKLGLSLKDAKRAVKKLLASRPNPITRDEAIEKIESGYKKD